jgi:hypothetical protein
MGTGCKQKRFGGDITKKSFPKNAAFLDFSFARGSRNVETEAPKPYVRGVEPIGAPCDEEQV